MFPTTKQNTKPHALYKSMRFLFFIALIISINACKKEELNKKPSLFLKTGSTYTLDGAKIPVGGKINFGIIASGQGAAITYLKIQRITDVKVTTEIDKGIYFTNNTLDTAFSFSKGDAEKETWKFFIMNANRDTISATLSVLKGEGNAYTSISYYPSVLLSFQNNQENGHFLDVDSGFVYDEISVTGHESEIDLMCFYYVTSGLQSPTFTCPSYPTAAGYYPQILNWSVKNSTLYDYYTSDYNLITAQQFEDCATDSLLVNGYKPAKVSGLSKYGYTGKIIPFKTSANKYGLIKVIRADLVDNGTINLAIKIQK